MSGARHWSLRCARDRRGASAAEFALVLPLLLILLFGIIDGGRFLWETNEAEKATQMGVRMAVVTNVLAPGLVSEDYTIASGGRPAVKAGDPIPASALGLIECTSAGCSGITTPYPSPGTMDSTTFNKIVDRMKAIDPNITAANVVVSYSGSGLGTAGDGGATSMDISPFVTVSVKNLKFVPITSLLLATLTLPSFSSTLTAEDASGQYSE